MKQTIHLILVGLATGGVIPLTRSFQMLKKFPSDSVSKSPILSCQKYVNYTPHLQISYIQSVQRVSSQCKRPCIRTFLSGGTLGTHLNGITLKIWVVSSKDSICLKTFVAHPNRKISSPSSKFCAMNA